MPVLRLSIALDPALLMTRATRGLFPLAAPTATTPWPTLGSWLVLRQGGLRDDLHRAAANAQVAGWFDPPVCLFAELATRWGGPTAPPLTAEERVALLTAVVARHAQGIFDRNGSADAWIPAIDRFVSELLSEGVAPDTLRTAQASRTDRDDFERTRDERLAAIYADWEFTLKQNARSDGRDSLVRLAQFIAHEPTLFAERLGGRRDLRIVGLADLRGGWRPLISALAACPVIDSITILASHALELPGSLNVEIEEDVPSVTLASSLFTGDTPADLRTLHLLEAPDAEREIEHVAVRVRALLDSGTTTAERIAVIVRQARPGVNRIADALEQLGVPVTARRRSALGQSGPAKALRSLLNAAALGFTRHAVVEVAEHPLLALPLDSEVLQAAGRSAPIDSLDAWEPALERLHERCKNRDSHPEDWAANRGLPSTTSVQDTLTAWRAWLPRARSLAHARTDSAWFDWVRDVLTDDAWGMTRLLGAAVLATDQENGDVVRGEIMAADQIITIAGRWTQALRELQVTEEPCDAEAFARRLALVLDGDTITQPLTSFGVVVSEALAAGWRTFDHVFLVGLSSGEFPSRPQPSALLPDRDRDTLVAAGVSIDAPNAWRPRERELFRVLCAAPRRSLTLSWPSMDGAGREVARSAFADEVIDAALRHYEADNEDVLVLHGHLVRVPTQQVLTPGFPVLARGYEDTGYAHALRVAAIERARSRALTAYNGQIEDTSLLERLGARYAEPYNWSATQLESLAKCGWSWFASRALRLDARSELDDSMEPTTRGTLLHLALQRFFERARGATNQPVYLRAPDREWVRPALVSALDSAWDTVSQTEWLGTPLMHDLLRAELLTQLTRYIEFEIGWNENSTDNRTKSSKQIQMGAAFEELTFNDVALDANGVRFRLRGEIDRVDIGVDPRVPESAQYIAAIDYKSSKGSTPAGGKKNGWDDGVVLQLPLYAKVLEQLHPTKTLARLEYRTLKRPMAVHTLEFVKLKTVAKARQIDISDEAQKRLDEAITHAGARVLDAREGRFAADPAPSCGCSPYCVGRDICRIPGGPVESSR